MRSTGSTPDGLSISAAIGHRLKRLREDHGSRQEFVAYVARKWGLSWSRSAVAQLEIGRRQLSLGEFLVLPHLLTRALMPQMPFQYRDLLPEDQEKQVALTPFLFVPRYALGSLIINHGVMDESPQGSFEGLFDRPETRRQRILSGAEVTTSSPQTQDEATYKAARVLRISPEKLKDVAYSLWGRSLLEERNRILIATGYGQAAPREVQAKRGHITRKLLAEVRRHLKQPDRKRRRKSSTTNRERR